MDWLGEGSAEMRGFRVRSFVRLGLVFLATLPPPAQAQQPGVVVQPAGWSLVVRLADDRLQRSSSQQAFWIGLKNIGDRAKAVCLTDISYDLIDSSHGVGDTIEGFTPSLSPHSCQTLIGASLILPGETQFVYGQVPLPDWVADGQNVNFSISYAAADPESWQNRSWMHVNGSHELRIAKRK